eukprot:1161529-Pelagomonas_calceolata.AAC.26
MLLARAGQLSTAATASGGLQSSSKLHTRMDAACARAAQEHVKCLPCVRGRRRFTGAQVPSLDPSARIPGL